MKPIATFNIYKELQRGIHIKQLGKDWLNVMVQAGKEGNKEDGEQWRRDGSGASVKKERIWAFWGG